MNLKDIIEGYTVDLDTDMEGHGADHPDRVTGCWVMHNCAGTIFSASLEALLAEGVLRNIRGSEWPVSQAAIAEIEDWALGHGY